MSEIVIRGAREHNLKGVNLDLPRNRLIVFTGPSGSGKSSLAFDTIYAEGQRRYVESLSVHARQALDRLARPRVDTIEGLSPAVAIEQRGVGKSPRSTVGTVSEVSDYLRLLFAKVGRQHCHHCGRRVLAQSVQEMVERIFELPAETRLAVLAPVAPDADGDYAGLYERLRRDGFTRVDVDGVRYELEEPPALPAGSSPQVGVYVDRLVLRPEARSRLAESVELALRVARGVVRVCDVDEADTVLTFSELPACHHCDLVLPSLSTQFLSFNSPQGACAHCGGIGALLEFDETLIVPDERRSLADGAIEPWAKRGAAQHQRQLTDLAGALGFSLSTPYSELDASIRELLMQGGPVTGLGVGREAKQTTSKRFAGVIEVLSQRLAERGRQGEGSAAAEDDELDDLNRYLVRRCCPACGGARLRPEALAVRVGERSIAEFGALSIREALDCIATIDLEARERAIAERILREVGERLAFLDGVGVGYLAIDRPVATLSGGEGQRVRLATQIGAALVGVIYILDEPSIGLHPRDTARLLAILRRLRDIGNTVLVVEHDRETILAADYVVDLGPGAGVAGGEVVAQGTPEEISRARKSVTGPYLAGRRTIEARSVPRPGHGLWLELHGARHNNLKGDLLRVPLGRFVCVTGVSGSGKSSLVMDTLLPALRRELHGARVEAGAHTSLAGARLLDKVVAVDQSPIGRSPRSNPASYTGIFPELRTLFAGVADARVRGFGVGRFSFNVKGGRCEACKGEGQLRVEMHFLPDVYVPCELCGGTRYNEETLKIRYRSKSIAEVLAMSVTVAHEFFQPIPRLRDKLEVLERVGLGYLELGQPANTLSGGEAQRIKLARELARRATGQTLYVLDEPTTGLHFSDIEVLLEMIDALVDAGNTVLVIEHNLDVIRCADYLIDLGPEGGEAGGHILAAGAPRELAANPRSETGRYLSRELEAGRR